jgi:cytochrome c-type biogenesis protein
MNVEVFAGQLATGAAWGPLAFGIAFIGGLVAGLGPCVLPMLPAVSGYVTGTVADSEVKNPAVRGFALSAVFVLGMSTVFACIGALAGLVGHALIVSSWAYYVAAGVCVLVGLQMLGVIDLRLDRINRWLPVKRPERRGFVGALAFGMLFGLVATPCSTPILAAIATMAASTGSVSKGAALLFVYGIGKGVPLLALGLASGSLSFMKSIGKMTPLLTKIGGVGMIGAGAYLVWIA